MNQQINFTGIYYSLDTWKYKTIKYIPITFLHCCVQQLGWQPIDQIKIGVGAYTIGESPICDTDSFQWLLIYAAQ